MQIVYIFAICTSTECMRLYEALVVVGMAKEQSAARDQATAAAAAAAILLV